MYRLLLLVLVFITTAVYAVDPRTYIPKNAYTYAPVAKEQVTKFFPELEMPFYIGGLVEQETCSSLTSKMCWNPKVELRSARERGSGL